ncbi:hypothetical protein [Gordonia sihwensis]|uniref:hypothetical protein n=1 Tax=Gordonia sihwensis TaxID=173559 RepID=UPI0005EDF806|nr:hypothetical protein [Gordonia sihwensis]KJR10251.1 hypothetical protein UG54_01340 [Gordonia sihwensis]
MRDLPRATRPNPSCGACGAETRLDGGRFLCEDCLLAFDPDSLDATYLHSQDQTCGHRCDNWWHGPGRINRGQGFNCQTCALPAGHTSMHWNDCIPINLSDPIPMVGLSAPRQARPSA